jgi:hypothetical protein
MARNYDSKKRRMEHEGRDHKRYEKDREGMEYARNSINEGSDRAMQRREDKSYGRYDGSQKLMSRDAGMIKEDWDAACLLPRGVIEKEWPGAGDYMRKDIPNLFSGVQETMREDGNAFMKSNKPRQY